jgi:hypothetical protein
MSYFSYVMALDIIILAILTLHFMITNKLKGNTEYCKGFLYSFFYVALLAIGYSFMWIFGQF